MTTSQDETPTARPDAHPDAEPGAGPVGASGAGGSVLRETAKGAGWLGLGAGVVKTAQTVVLLVLAALLAPEALGVLAIGALVLNVTSAVTDLGSSTALVYWRGDAERAARSALTLALALALVLTTSAWLVAPWLAEALNAGTLGAEVIRGLMLCLPCYAVAGVSQELLRRELAFKRRVIPEIAAALAGATLSIGLAVAGFGVHALVAGQLLQAVAMMLLFWIARPPVWFGWRLQDVRGLVSYGGHLAAASILSLLMLNVDYVIVARVLGPEPLGVYSMAFRLAYMPYLLVAMVISGAAFAYLCRLRGVALGRAVTEVTAALLVVVVPAYVGMMVLAPQLELLGSAWAAGVPALRWLAAYGLLLSVLTLAVVTLNAVGRPRDGMLLTLAHLVLLTLLLLRFASMGVHAVAVVQAVAVAVVLLATLATLARRVEGLAWRALGLAVGPVLVGAIAMALVGTLAQITWPALSVSVVGLLLVGSAMVLAYALPVAVAGRSALRLLHQIREGA